MAGLAPQPASRRLYSAKLLGIDGPVCSIPKCRGPASMPSTGWLEFSQFNNWCVEFNCPLHGPALVYGWNLTARITEALKDNGSDLSAGGAR